MQNHIAKYRKLHKWTQEQLAHKVGIRRLTLTMYELGHNTPPLPVALRLAAALRVSVTKLFPLEDPLFDTPNAIEVAKGESS